MVGSMWTCRPLHYVTTRWPSLLRNVLLVKCIFAQNFVRVYGAAAARWLWWRRTFGRAIGSGGQDGQWGRLLAPDFEGSFKPTMQIFPLWNYRDSYRSCKYYGVSSQFLQPFSIDYPCGDPAIPSPRSFHGVKICNHCLSSTQSSKSEAVT